ncbi:alkaline phosphatase family protein, partial [Nanoarchaeota archaeon]
MKEFTLPDYNGGSIVNLMSSIAKSFGTKTIYPPLKILPPEKLKDKKNIALLVIDGMGYEYLKKKEKMTILNDYLAGSMTSVFLPTTASAIATFLTGVAPQQHAFTGWYMLLKEIGVVSTILPFSPRVGGNAFSSQGIEVKDVLNQKAFTSKIKASNFSINHKKIAYSDFSKEMSKNSKILPYGTLNGFFMQIKKAINSNSRRKYIYAYWPELDSLNHKHGVEHKKAEKHFKEIDKKLRSFIKSLKGTNTLLIITADHGFTNTPVERIIKLEDHPKMKECLTLPLCGEGRVSYCYVHPEKAKQFENYVKKNLGKYCHLFKSQELIKKNYFGLKEPNPKLFDRIGDYILVFKENYIIEDKIKRDKKKKKPNIGHHGGVSRNEMIVPLILIDSPLGLTPQLAAINLII